MDVHDSLWPADDVNVVQKREQLLVWPETLSHSFQSSVLPLRTGLASKDRPVHRLHLGRSHEQRRGHSPRCTWKRNCRTETRMARQNRSDPIHGNHRCCVVQIRKGLNDVRHAFDSRSGRERVLVRRCGLLHCGVDLLCDRASDQPTKSVSHHNSADPS